MSKHKTRQRLQSQKSNAEDQKSKLSLREQRFADNYIASGKASEAARVAGYKAERVRAHLLLKDPDVKEYIHTKATAMQESLDVTSKWKIERLKEIVMANIASHDDVAIRAIAELNKMQGDYAPTKIDNRNLNVNVTFTQIKELVSEYDREY